MELELKHIDFITIGTIGPKGQRVFYLQAGENNQLVSLVIEKEQSQALSEAIQELIEDLRGRVNEITEVDIHTIDMDLREPIEPIFRVSQMGLGYDEDKDKIVLVAQELVPLEGELDTPSVVRFYCSRAQMQALSLQAIEMVNSGRADPKQNGRLVYYWT